MVETGILKVLTMIELRHWDVFWVGEKNLQLQSKEIPGQAHYEANNEYFRHYAYIICRFGIKCEVACSNLWGTPHLAYLTLVCFPLQVLLLGISLGSENSNHSSRALHGVSSGGFS